MSQVAVPSGAPPPAAPVEPSAAERLFAAGAALWRRFNSLEPSEVAVNLALSVAVALATLFIIWILRRLICQGLDRIFVKDRPDRSAKPQVARTTWPLVKAATVLAGLLAILSIWGVDIIGWLTIAPAGRALLRIAAIILIAVALMEAARYVVDRLLSALVFRRTATRRNAQVKTLRPLLHGCVQGFIVVLASLTIFSELGVKIGPLLASAGVVGVAVGFGAQSLVKDFLTGVFLVVEDIVAIGDNVRIGDRSGTVEAMTLRTIRIRNIDGTLHILPYGEAQVISNRTQSYSSYVFEIPIGYGAKFEHVFEVMQQTGARLQENPEIGPKISKPLEILGIDRLGETVAVVKARFVTTPGQQWIVGRAFNRLIKEAFDAEGIDMHASAPKAAPAKPAAPAPPAPAPPLRANGDGNNDPE